jgi:signal peptidase I
MSGASTVASAAVATDGAGARRRPVPKEARRLLRYGFVLASLLSGVAFAWSCQISVISGNSMLPTLSSSDLILVSRLSYQLGPIRAGDIVVFSRPSSRATSLVKRVVALPGNIVEWRGGRLYVEGAAMDTGTPGSAGTGHDGDGVHVVPAGHYYVLGDDRAESTDSRVFGDIARESIEGKAVFRFWPLSRLGSLMRLRPQAGGSGGAP